MKQLIFAIALVLIGLYSRADTSTFERNVCRVIGEDGSFLGQIYLINGQVLSTTSDEIKRGMMPRGLVIGELVEMSPTTVDLQKNEDGSLRADFWGPNYAGRFMRAGAGFVNLSGAYCKELVKRDLWEKAGELIFYIRYKSNSYLRGFYWPDAQRNIEARINASRVSNIRVDHRKSSAATR
jgi:hypothetical protein